MPARSIVLTLLCAVSAAAAPTFTKDVAPIFYKNCVSCHRPGEIAPMSLLDYQSARPWAKAIREAVAVRKMPPWFADPKVVRAASSSQMQAITSISTNELPGMPPGAAIVVRTGGSGPNLPWKTSFIPA